MRIITETISRRDLEQLAENSFGNLVKAVVDVDRGILALDADMHSDLETHLLQNGSKQENLWGINLYPSLESDDFIEFDSMINVRPSQGNRGRGVDDESIRQRIIAVVQMRVSQ